ncbi:MAG TPA: hypothetical protein VJ714_00235 [Anaerolineae bacterium]|jgi:hypothetical protein|nr:hypothetical protein [Anaerolineae bacterium]
MSDEWKRRLISIAFTLAAVALIGLVLAPLPLWTPRPTPTPEPTPTLEPTPTVAAEAAGCFGSVCSARFRA